LVNSVGNLNKLTAEQQKFNNATIYEIEERLKKE
jgi:hypothetical protein